MSVPPSPAAPRDRFLSFAFAAADLLVETEADGKIAWAAGAFASRFARAAEEFLGQPVEELVAPVDRVILAQGLAQAALRGRLAPVLLRLNDAKATACVLGALALPDQANRLCLTFSSLPAALPATPSAAPAPSGPETLGPETLPPEPLGTEPVGPVLLRQQAESSLRAGEPKTLTLLDVAGWPPPQGSQADSTALRADIMETLMELGGSGVLMGEMGRGRFGVLAGQEVDLHALITTLQEVIQTQPGGHGARVSGQAIPLGLPGLTPDQAARALRFALVCFAEGGLAAVSAAGFARGLAGFINDTGDRAAQLRNRIAARKFRLAYQPIVGLRDRVAHHHEALLRPMPGAEGSAQDAQYFITFAEAMGLSEELDLAVMEEVLLVLRRNKQAHVAANISGLSLQNPPFGERLLALIAGQSRLSIELTETAEISDPRQVAAVLAVLRERGVSVCIDDFGAGSAGFRYLRDFRVDFVKIDGSYVQAASASPRGRGIVASMCDLARAVNAAVIAEMVEHEEQAGLMAEIGVEYGQGYLFGRPGPLPGAWS